MRCSKLSSPLIADGVFCGSGSFSFCRGLNVIDYNSLLIALSFCSIGLAFTFFVNWYVSRADRVLMTWGIGVSFLVLSLFVYRDFVEEFSPVVGVVAFAALLIGLTFFLGAGRQFNTGSLPVVTMLVTATLSIAAMAAPMLAGYDGVSYIILNIAAAAIMFATGLDYWRWRGEAPMLIILLTSLYSLTSLSFVLCAVVLVLDQSWVMHHAPSGLVENINLGMCLTSIGAMGALSLGLNQVRQTRHHKREAETDSLTGLFNRRALFDQARQFPGAVSIVIFDIDHFKRINDMHGHQLGDTVLQTFGSLLSANIRDCDMAARLGGEEFAIVLPDTVAEAASAMADRVRQSFAAQRFISPAGDFSSTVSAGVSYSAETCDLAALLRQADVALYEAKHAGRNQVIVFHETPGLVPDNRPIDRPQPDAIVRLRS
jgi:diguanylate cyclase (GGDEF)-like protein